MQHLRVVDQDISTADQRVARASADMLREIAGEADRGDVVEIVVVAVLADGSYKIYHTETMDIARRLGLLELASHAEIRSALES